MHIYSLSRSDPKRVVLRCYHFQGSKWPRNGRYTMSKSRKRSRYRSSRIQSNDIFRLVFRALVCPIDVTRNLSITQSIHRTCILLNIPCQPLFSLFSLPIAGMFSEAYLVFSVGNIGSFQKAAFPDCYKTYAVCPHDMITQKIDSYVQIIGIIIGMMLMGLMGKSTSEQTNKLTTSIN